jgi:hypothetical protein
MDQREPPRTPPPAGRPTDPDAAEGPHAPSPRRFPRLAAPPSARRISWQRLAVGATLALGAAWLAGLAVRWGVAYVHAQPLYQLTYGEIVLDPPPPGWYRGGAGTFLDHVWQQSQHPKTFSLLDVEPDRLTLLFKRYAWVREVVRVEKRHPNRVIVRLEYREPVACDWKTGTVIDRDGVILPVGDFDREAVSPLVGLVEFSPSDETRPGLCWGRADPHHEGICLPDERVAVAARLADFLKPRLKSLSDVLPKKHVVYVQDWDKQGLCVQVIADGSDALVFEWYEPDVPPAVLKKSPDEKWTMLCDWVRRSPPGDGRKWIYLKFTESGVAFHYEQLPPPSSSALAPRTRPEQTIRK